MSDTVRLSIKVPADIADTVKAMAKDRDTSVTQVIRGAITLEAYIEECERNGWKFLLELEDGTRERVFGGGFKR